jgi:hypothetical protein
MLVWAGFQRASEAALHARLEIVTEPNMPVRVYLFKGDRPFRLSPVDAVLPLRVDLFYRERLWRRTASPEVLEVTCRDQSHFFLLNGHASFDLPAGEYRLEAYRGFFYEPVVESFQLETGKARTVRLAPRNWLGEDESKQWISADDHIHITRAREDDDVFLRWLAAEDLSVGNFLQLQRQVDAGVQYAMGPDGEVKRDGYVIRPGHESRSEFYGHVNLLGGRQLVRPLSIGNMYANSPEAYPYPLVLFSQGRKLGATVGYAHLDGSTPHSTLLMDLALETADFIEVFQFGVLKTEQWYEVLNAGLRVTGIAGSDFPVSLNRQTDKSRRSPLLGPERALVKAPAGDSPYEAWAAGVRSGDVVVSNGPLVELEVDPETWIATATARYYRPLEVLEVVRNGQVVASEPGGQDSLRLTAQLDKSESCWVAARVKARKNDNEPEDSPPIQAHTNPTYLLRDGSPVMVRRAREALASHWESELAHYRGAGLVFADDSKKAEFFHRAEQALEVLRRPLDQP